MDSDGIRTILTVIVLLICSAYFSATETAFSSLNRVRIKHMAEEGDKRAARVLSLSEKFDRVLSTILIGNNIVNIAMATISTVLFVRFFGDRGTTLSTAVITVVVLIFGEITPKNLAKEFPERFAILSAPLLQLLVWVFTPLSVIFSAWNTLLSRLFQSRSTPSVTEDELLTYVQEAATGGSIDAEESQLIRSAIEFNDLEAADIFTPRVDVVGVECRATEDEVAAAFADSGFSRLPVYDDSIDSIVGIIHQKDFFNEVYRKNIPLSAIIKAAQFIPPSMKIGDLLRLLQKTKSHMAIVADEYGGTAGIVTMEDILEELVGEIWDEHDEVVEEFHRIGEHRYRIVCSADFDKLYEFFHMTGSTESATVGGWVMEQLGRIPAVGDSFTYENLSVTVTKTDDRRVLEIVVTVLPQPEEE